LSDTVRRELKEARAMSSAGDRVHAIRGVVAATVAAILCASASAATSTTITGGNVINQTWSPAGSPYIIQGDITVPSGALLNIQPGVDVQFATTDGMAAELDTGRVELTVKGTLNALGSAALPITLHVPGSSSTTGWYGVVVSSSAAAANLS